MNLRLADRTEADALPVRGYLKQAGERAGVDPRLLEIETVQWSRLFDDRNAQGAPPPTVADYATEYGRPLEQAKADLAEFKRATGVDPIRFWEIENEALEASANNPAVGDLLNDVFVVATAD